MCSAVFKYGITSVWKLLFVSPVRVSLCDVDTRQRGNWKACGSGSGYWIFFRCQRPSSIPLLFCLSPWQRRQLQIAWKPSVDFAHLYSKCAAQRTLSRRKLLSFLRVKKTKHTIVLLSWKWCVIKWCKPFKKTYHTTKSNKKDNALKFENEATEHINNHNNSGGIQISTDVWTLSEWSLCPAHTLDDEVLYGILVTFMSWCSSSRRHKLSVWSKHISGLSKPELPSDSFFSVLIINLVFNVCWSAKFLRRSLGCITLMTGYKQARVLRKQRQAARAHSAYITQHFMSIAYKCKWNTPTGFKWTGRHSSTGEMGKSRNS